MLVEKYEEREKLEDKAQIENIEREMREEIDAKIEEIKREMPEEIKANFNYITYLNQKFIRVNFTELDLALFAHVGDKTVEFERKSVRLKEEILDLIILLRKSFHEIF